MTRKYTCEDLEERIRTLEAELDKAKRTAEALRESEAKYKKLSDKSLLGVVYQFMMAPDGTYSFPYINDSLRAVTGISPEDAMRDASVLVGKIHPEDIDRFHKGVLESANSLTPYHAVLRFFIDERQSGLKFAPPRSSCRTAAFSGAVFSLISPNGKTKETL